jgi:hypothetical protein
MALWDDLALNVMVEVEDDVELLWDTGTHVSLVHAEGNAIARFNSFLGP